jgi:hypothetical protein
VILKAAYSADANFGSKNAGDLPVDNHELIALCAPRLTFITYSSPEKYVKYLDPKGSFMGAVAAAQVFRFLGAKDLGIGDDYKTARMPAAGVGIMDGQLAWWHRDDDLGYRPNWKHFIAWADRFLDHQSVTR